MSTSSDRANESSESIVQGAGEVTSATTKIQDFRSIEPSLSSILSDSRGL